MQSFSYTPMLLIRKQRNGGNIYHIRRDGISSKSSHYPIETVGNMGYTTHKIDREKERHYDIRG